jgi:hypothetical protein
VIFAAVFAMAAGFKFADMQGTSKQDRGHDGSEARRIQ